MIAFLKTAVISFAIIFSVTAIADSFRVLDQRQLPNHLGTYVHSQIAPADAFDKIDIYTAKLTNSYRARFYLQPVASQPQSKFMGNLVSVEDFILAINGGFYTPEFQPVGLMIDQGKRLKRFSKNRLLTSCVTINKQGKMLLIPRCNSARCLLCDANWPSDNGPWTYHG